MFECGRLGSERGAIALMNRRAFIVTLTSVLSLSGSRVIRHGSANSSNVNLPQAIDKLLRFIPDHKSARTVGKSYLRSMPQENDLKSLVALILGPALPEKNDHTSVMSIVERRIRQDFDNDAIAVVDGWVLSRTECRIYALASLI